MMPAPVIAAGLDWLEGLLPAVFVGFWILSQVFALFRRVPKGNGPVIVVQPAPADDVPRVDRQTLESEIEKFLLERRATARPVTPREPPPLPTKPVRRRPQQQGDGHRSRPPTMPPAAPPSRAAATPTIDSDIARHVQDAFAHDLAHEVPVSPGDGAPAPRPTAGSGLAALLRDPATIRHVIVMREVLERPTDRWA